MKILNFGSLNIDHVYSVDHIVRPGETLSSSRYQRFCGGKGLNQSIALARAGAQVLHAGKVGAEGLFLKERLARDGVNAEYVDVVDDPGGHAIIQVDPRGENSIVLFGGANKAITRADAARPLEAMSPGDFLLLQNEISAMADIMALASQKGLRIAFNPAPFGPEVPEYPLDAVDVFFVNETEGQGLTGEQDPQAMLRAMRARFPKASLVLTLGAEGALFANPRERHQVDAVPVEAVDTTAAGDTFIGFFLAEFAKGGAIPLCLGRACRAAALCVARPGAADSIPLLGELET